MDVFAGIDLGTTHLKLVLTNDQAHVLWSDKWPVQTHQPQAGWQEQDPIALREAVLEALRQLVKQLPPTATRCIIGFSTAMHGLLLVDDNGQPLTSLITWADTRSQPQAAALRTSSLATAIYQHTGTPVHPMSTFCKLCWIKEERPELLSETTRVLTHKDWIWSSLTGHYEMDHSVASSTGLLDIHQRQWYAPALQQAGIEQEQLSRPVPVTHQRSADTHYTDLAMWPIPLVWVIGGSDGYLATLGSGATRPGDMALTIGTSGAVRVLRSSPVPDSGGMLFHYAADEGQYLCGGATNNGGNLLGWFAGIFLEGAPTSEGSLQYWLDQAAAVEPGAGGLRFVPYVYGERAPVWDATATASFTGIHAGHTRAHFLRAILEGVADNLAAITAALEASGEKIERVYASGGFTASPLWVNIVSQALHKPLILLQEADASALGAIYVAMKAVGLGQAGQ